MKQRFLLGLMIGCLATMGLFSQAPQPEVSLDDYPAGFGSAENEWGQANVAFNAGFIGPSPTLGLMGFFDSDVMIPVGPILLLTFPPPPKFVDAISCDHSPMVPCGGGLFIRFSVDRATGGLSPNDASWNQAAVNEQPADIYRTDRPYSHVGNFVPLPPPAAGVTPVYPWTPFCGGVINVVNGFSMANGFPADGPAGTGCCNGAFNQMMYDHMVFPFIPAPPAPPIAAGTHDNVDGFNEWPVSMAAPAAQNPNNFFCLHPASANGLGFSAADIFVTPNPPGLVWPATVIASANQCGLDTFGNNTDSIDGLSFFDYARKGKLDPGQDYAAFTLAPGSATLTTLWAAGFNVNAATVFVTDFRINTATGSGYFYIWLFDCDLGVGNGPNANGGGPLPVLCPSDINVDALDLTIDPDPVPYVNPITTPVIDPGTKK